MQEFYIPMERMLIEGTIYPALASSSGDILCIFVFSRQSILTPFFGSLIFHKYEQKLTLCWGLTPQTLSTIPTRITTKQQTLSHPSIYNDALPEAKFFCLFSKLLRTCGYNEFGFKDLAAPQAKRLRRQLSALINFLKYREDMGHLEAQALEEVSA